MIWEKRNFQQTGKRRLTLAVFLDSLCVLVSSLILELVGPSSILGAFKGHSLDWFLDIIPIPRPCCQWPTGFPTASWEGFQYLFVMLFITILGNAINREVLHEKTTSLSILPVKYPSLMKIMHCRNSLSNELSNLHLTKLSTVTDVIHKISPSC